MHKTLVSLLLASALAATAGTAGTAAAAAPRANEAATARYYASLVKGEPAQLAGLTMFFSAMPKGGDLHHHYSGAIYAEQYLGWVDRMGYCVNKLTYRIETDKAVAQTQAGAKGTDKTCLSGAEVLRDDPTYRELLQRWSSKDFDNHGAIQPPPDRQFFDTFGYFGPVSNDNFNAGLQTIKQRALAEHVGYIETMFKMAPPNPDDPAWDAAVLGAADDGVLRERFAAMDAALAGDNAFHARMGEFVNTVKAASAGIDDANFTMRYQTYVLRLLAPSQVFSSMIGAFESARRSDGLIVGVNIVGAENNPVAMRDYTLHMKMFQYLHARYPDVKLDLHAGELALGMVPPEGLRFHIRQAVELGGALRIGHGIDLAYEQDAAALLRELKAKDIPVEINLTSNGFINGVNGAAHPITLYRQFGVPYVISTDDAGVTRHDLAHEYAMFASRYRPDYAELKRASYNAVRYSFAAEADKARLLRQLDERFARFEAEVATWPLPARR